MDRTPKQHPTNGWDVAKIAVICVTVCIVSMFGTASNWSDLSEVKTSGISVGGVAAALIGARKAGCCSSGQSGQTCHPRTKQSKVDVSQYPVSCIQ